MNFTGCMTEREKAILELENQGKEAVEEGDVVVLGAREHNLQNIDVVIPRNKLSVITGLSGSGKSSLAFDTIYAEGQRRYLETFSAYARQVLGALERPDVDKITGLSPVISIEQKTTNKNPRSTVGTTTEIYDFLRLLFARAGTAYSYVTGEKMVQYSDDQILRLLQDTYKDQPIYLMAPVVRSRKGHYRELFMQIRKKGFIYARVDGELREVTPNMKLDRYKTHSIEIVVDKLKVKEDHKKRLRQSVEIAMQHGNGVVMIEAKDEPEGRYYSRNLMCPTSGISYDEPAPNTFSFNSPKGACEYCHGLGRIKEIDPEKIIPDKSLSIRKGGLAPLGKFKNTLIFWQLETLAEKYDKSIDTPLGEFPEKAIQEILYGTDYKLQLKNTPLGTTANYELHYDGLVKYIRMQMNDTSRKAQNWARQFYHEHDCQVCGGSRISKIARSFKIHDKNIAELAEMDIKELADWLENIEDRLSDKQKHIAVEILKEIRARLRFLLNVGLDYLSLNRSTRSLSGGESQRIRLATQIGSELVNVLYILDEPSIGLHQRDNHRLLNSLKRLRDNGNSIIVVEHDRDTMLSADHIIDLGPGAGKHGGELVAEGPPKKILKANTLTSDYLNGKKHIEIPWSRREGKQKSLKLKGADGNNLQNVNVEFPLGKFICVTGVSGSGKSTLVNETLHPALSQDLYRSVKEPHPYEKITGKSYVDKVIEVDQAPIGRTPRSNPVTYTGVFSDIRSLFARLPEAKIRGYKPGRFSFNVKGGRCETCKGAGVKVIEMNFLPDVHVPCEDCQGRRYNRETLEVRYKGKSISDVLDMTINQAVEFFANIPSIVHKLKAVQEVGLGYITLGQSSTTLSGGEAQRVKLASELAKKDTGKTMYILDEPTTGLHFEDIRVLLGVLNRLVDKGNTVIVIEHNMDVIKMADHIIDMGPEGGKDGGKIIATGTPEKLAKRKDSFTGQFLKAELNEAKYINKHG